jgi:hypothetical protein
VFTLFGDDGGIDIFHLEFVRRFTGHGPGGNEIKGRLSIMALGDMNGIHGKIMSIRSILGQGRVIPATGSEKGGQWYAPQREGEQQGEGHQPDNVSAIEEPLRNNQYILNHFVTVPGAVFAIQMAPLFF